MLICEKCQFFDKRNVCSIYKKGIKNIIKKDCFYFEKGEKENEIFIDNGNIGNITTCSTYK